MKLSFRVKEISLKLCILFQIIPTLANKESFIFFYFEGQKDLNHADIIYKFNSGAKIAE